MGLACHVDPHRARIQCIGCSDCLLHILREDRRGQSIVAIIRLSHNVVLVLEFKDNADRSKNLFAYNLHVRLHVSEDRGLNEVAFRAYPLAASVQCRALLLARPNVIHDTLVNNFQSRAKKYMEEIYVVLCLGYQGTLKGVQVKRVANLNVLRVAGKSLQELVVDLLMYKNPRTRSAGLARIEAVCERSIQSRYAINKASY